jgi:hypothetical protein
MPIASKSAPAGSCLCHLQIKTLRPPEPKMLLASLITVPRGIQHNTLFPAVFDQKNVLVRFSEQTFRNNLDDHGSSFMQFKTNRGTVARAACAAVDAQVAPDSGLPQKVEAAAARVVAS